MCRVHRVAYELFSGPIPNGLVLDHLCRNRGCFNPNHLEPVTRAVNNLRGVGFMAAHARKTHCPKGHPYDEKNTQIKNGARRCRACISIENRRYREKQKAAREAQALQLV
ncbi:HNH endonuclease signature motif containing protein [Arthrobacter koreensis]|uniref:HNH endonuclease signature motif containing protein n=1 Tax=Arthrobacter koreensis TaxID=199136 RepID=UPI00381BE6E9